MQRKKFDLWTKLNFTYYLGGLELQYEHIKPKILAEQFIENDGGDLYDYKFCCFDGEPKVIIYIMNRYVDADERIVCFDTDWNLLPFNIFTRWSSLMTSRVRKIWKRWLRLPAL